MMRLRQLAGDSSGATLVEFALIAPALLTLLLGLFEMGYNYYMQSLLQGSIQQAARDSTIEGAYVKQTEIDTAVTNTVHQIVPDATITFQRRAYSSFSKVNQPEDFTDANNDGDCNDGEPFEDANGNGIWDADRGRTGLGGARDAVLYQVTVSYPRTFGVSKLIGMSDTFTTTATTVLRNQPYDKQAVELSVGNCP
ncbi:MAG: pilus assembly protein [Sphingomonadales bacterium]|nr:pilus assembly protein [Sphingomonadales bacterium]MBD3772194.1 pilus assembly protein [Paracoccaceae bacterium]